MTIDPRKLADFMTSEDGPAFRRMLEAADLVKEEAKQLVGYSDRDAGPTRGAGGRFVAGTPHLRDTIVKRVVHGEKPVIEIGSESPIALWHHEGTQPHPIYGNPLLVFYWPRVGHVVSLRSVWNRGTQPNRYLVDALRVLRGRF